MLLTFLIIRSFLCFCMGIRIREVHERRMAAPGTFRRK